ncbi:unnamed protein product, partial [marine sediment metagenome]
MIGKKKLGEGEVLHFKSLLSSAFLDRIFYY